jgi:hypothetical protein
MAKAETGSAAGAAGAAGEAGGNAAEATGTGRALVIGGHRSQPQRRAGRRSDWTQAKADKFIEVLADSCNVSLAARAIKRSVANVYIQRTKDARFRAQWDQALAIGYARLEMMMLERALHGVEKVIVLKSGETKVMREYPDRVALALLRMHRESVGFINEGVDDDDYQEACERIIARLERLRERDEEEDAGRAVETKQAVDRLAVMLWGLRRVDRMGSARPPPRTARQ